MRRRLIIGIVAAVAAVSIAGGAVAYGSAESERNITGPQADRAKEAALEATGGGTATGVELDADGGAKWEVEITETDGSTVEVTLDDRYEVVAIEGDTESGDDDD